MSIRAAAGRVEITTDKNIVHDSLFAKVLVLENNDELTALISMDCICLGGEVGQISDRFFKTLKDRLKNQNAVNLICGTTHTHTADPMVLDEDRIIMLIEEKVSELKKELQPVTVGVSEGKVSEFIINRSIKLKSGEEWTLRLANANPPEDEYDELNYADAAVKVMRFNKKDNSPLCVLFTFGCHPLLGYADNGVTANFPGVAEKMVENATGATAMMFQSTAGDVIETDYKDYTQPKNCEKGGYLLGNEVLRVLKNIKTSEIDISSYTVERTFPLRNDIGEIIENLKIEQSELCTSMNKIPWDFKNFLPMYMKYLISPEYPLKNKYEYLKEKELGINQLEKQDELNRRYIERYLDNLKKMERIAKIIADIDVLSWHKKRSESEKEFNAEITGIRIGDIILVTAPYEPLNCIKKELDKISKNIWLIGYSNGYIHYGATSDKYIPGGYEVCECDLDKNWFELYNDAVKEIVAELCR